MKKNSYEKFVKEFYGNKPSDVTMEQLLKVFQSSAAMTAYQRMSPEEWAKREKWASEGKPKEVEPSAPAVQQGEVHGWKGGKYEKTGTGFRPVEKTVNFDDMDFDLNNPQLEDDFFARMVRSNNNWNFDEAEKKGIPIDGDALIAEKTRGNKITKTILDFYGGIKG